MPATWTAPLTWTTDQLVTASDLNTHLRDNLEFLKDPPTTAALLNESANYSTTSTTFVNVDATKLTLTLTTSGGAVLIGFSGMCLNSGGTFAIYFDVDIDGARFAGDDGITGSAAAAVEHFAFAILKTGLAAGTHTFKLMWRVSAGTGVFYTGAGTANADIHPYFWAREV